MTDTRKQALDSLATFCQGIIPTRVASFPSASDGIELANDLRLLTDRVDRVIAAYGDYAQSTLGSVDLDLFKDQLLGTLDGNALYEIEQAAQEHELFEDDDAADHRFALARGA